MPTPDAHQHATILAAGDFPTHPRPLQALQEADLVVCCDSAYTHLVASGIAVRDCVVVGDGDSLTEADKEALGGRWLQVDEQDYNDLHKAMCYAAQRVSSDGGHFTIVGATGRREDHTMGNLAYLATFAEEYPKADIEMLTDYGRFVHLHGQRTFSTFPHQQVSIITLTPTLPLYGEGLRWPLDHFYARLWWQATLNEALGDSVALRTEGHALVFQTYAPKA